MEVGTKDDAQRTSAEEIGGDAPPSRDAYDPAVLRASAGAELSPEEEQSALEWLLGTPEPNRYDVPARLETPTGVRELTFVIRQVDARKIDKIEVGARNELTGVMDVFAVAAGIVRLGTEWIEDDSGRRIDLTSEEFRTVRQADGELVVIADPAEALTQRFRWQLGLLQGVAREIRRVAGVEADRVGKAQRRLVVASGNS